MSLLASLRFVPQVGHGPIRSFHSLSAKSLNLAPLVALPASARVGSPPSADPPREVVLAYQHVWVE